MHTLSGEQHEVKDKVGYRLATIQHRKIDSLPADADIKHQLHTVDRKIVNKRHSRAT